MLTSLLILATWQPIQLREVYLTHRTFKEGSREPVLDNANIPNEILGQELSLHFDSDLFCKHMFWNNHVLSYVSKNTETGNPAQFRNVGWEFNVGVRLWNWGEVSYYHFSKHVMDEMYPDKFPVMDAIEVKLWLFKD